MTSSCVGQVQPHGPTLASTLEDGLAVYAPDERTISLLPNLTEDEIAPQDRRAMMVLPSPVPGMVLISVTGNGYGLMVDGKLGWKIGDVPAAEDVTRLFFRDPLIGIVTYAAESQRKQYRYLLDASGRIAVIQVKYMADGSAMGMRQVP